jgi:hypothetical protein
VTDPNAGVGAARELPPAGPPAGVLLDVTRDGLPELVLGVAVLGGEDGARRTVGGRVTVVEGRVFAGVRAWARASTLGHSGTAGDGREDHLGSAFAVKLFKT